MSVVVVRKDLDEAERVIVNCDAGDAATARRVVLAIGGQSVYAEVMNRTATVYIVPVVHVALIEGLQLLEDDYVNDSFNQAVSPGLIYRLRVAAGTMRPCVGCEERNPAIENIAMAGYGDRLDRWLADHPHLVSCPAVARIMRTRIDEAAAAALTARLALEEQAEMARVAV